MSAREAQRRAEQSRQSDPAADRELELNQFRVMSFAQWCALNGISPATGRRLLRSGRGPIVTRLSDRRIASPSAPTWRGRPNGRSTEPPRTNWRQ
jgi:hypothetical protein